MSRENFVMKCTHAETGETVYINISNINTYQNIKAADKLVEHTLVSLVGGDKVKIKDKVEEIERRCAMYGIMKVIV